MKRRGCLAGLAIGVGTLSGCTSIFPSTESRTSGEDESAGDGPQFSVDETAAGAFKLLRKQVQTPSGVSVGDSFEIGIVLGNAGGDPIAGEVTLELIPPNDDQDVQTDTLEVESADEIPSGAAKFYVIGAFQATVAGTWELIAGPDIEQVHSQYDGRIVIEA